MVLKEMGLQRKNEKLKETSNCLTTYIRYTTIRKYLILQLPMCRIIWDMS